MASRILVSLRITASADRVFDTFVNEIGLWWRPNLLFQFTPNPGGRLAFEPGPAGRLVERQPDGTVFEIGRIRIWNPPERLVFGWRHASFRTDQDTEVEVRFEAVGAETRVTVQHTGWDTIPTNHVARHGFPDAIFLRRHAEWWQALTRSLFERLNGEG